MSRTIRSIAGSSASSASSPGLAAWSNTSFNIHEEPIVCTPEDAIRAFQIGHLDVLALGPFIAKHPEADARVRATRPGRS